MSRSVSKQIRGTFCSRSFILEQTNGIAFFKSQNESPKVAILFVPNQYFHFESPINTSEPVRAVESIGTSAAGPSCIGGDRDDRQRYCNETDRFRSERVLRWRPRGYTHNAREANSSGQKPAFGRPSKRVYRNASVALKT